MAPLDHILNTPVAGRSRNLQTLIKHFLEIKPSLMEQLDSLTPSISFSLQQEQEMYMENCVVNLFRSLCDNGKKTVLIYDGGASFQKSRILQFCGPDIIESLRQSGFNTWFVDPSTISDHCLSFDKALLERMSFIAVILIGPWGLTLDHNRDTKTFKLPFSASLAPEWEDLILLNDFFYVPNHRTTDNLFDRYRSSFPLPLDQTKHRRTFTAIPIGNLKNCRIRRARRTMPPEDRNKILFCAEAYDYANSVAKNYGILLIKRILERFPQSTLIYRSHPNWINDPINLSICEAFAGEQRFEFDTNISSETIMASGCALITDGSLSGLTYCMSACRPAVFFNPSELSPHFDSNVMGFDFEDGKLFRFASSIDETLEALEDLVADPAKEFEDISELAEKAYAHPDDGLKYLLDSIHAIVENRILSDWKTLEVHECNIGDGSAGDYAGLLRNNLLRFPEFYRFLKLDLSLLNGKHDAIRNMIQKTQSHRFGHLQSIIRNFNALCSGISTYGCSMVALEMIDLLFEPIIERGNTDEVNEAIKILHNTCEKSLHDAREGLVESRSIELFQSSFAGTILSKVSNVHNMTEMLSLIAELRLAPRVPKGLIVSMAIDPNEAGKLIFSCRDCNAHQSMNVHVWYSYNAICDSCGTLNHIDPFDEALHLPNAFFAKLPTKGEVVLWGAGGFFYKLMQKYNDLSLDRFLLVDINKTQQGLSICKKSVHSPEIIVLKNIKTVIITALSRKDEICVYLRDTYPSLEFIFAPTLDITPDGIVPILTPL